jgi:hypothetical protein
LNHPCDPNAIRKGTFVYAWKDIKESEEITIDYRLNAFTNEQVNCFCGSKNCPGYYYLSYFSLGGELQAAYFPYAPKFIQDEYRRRKSLMQA